jgi:hypothetical protein
MPAMDKLHAYETLWAKFDEDRAKILVGVMADLVTPSFADLATKADIEQLRQTTQAEFRTTTAELRVEVQGIKAELIRWLFGAMVAIVSAMSVAITPSAWGEDGFSIAFQPRCPWGIAASASANSFVSRVSQSQTAALVGRERPVEGSVRLLGDFLNGLDVRGCVMARQQPEFFDRQGDGGELLFH